MELGKLLLPDLTEMLCCTLYGMTLFVCCAQVFQEKIHVIVTCL